jgi:hypothetical protein
MAFSRARVSSAVRAAGLLPALLLAGCGYEDTSRFAPECPRVAVLADAADVTEFRPSAAGGHDLTDMVLDGRITGLSGKCARASETLLSTHVVLSMSFSRGPGAVAREVDVPYFLGVFEGDSDILDKKIFPVHVVFPPNVDRVVLDTQDVELTLPISHVKSGAVYTVRAGFQLSPEQLAFNRRRGPRA